jgi:hypothetical protein
MVPLTGLAFVMSKCLHQNVHCLNGYELIRKYRCVDCGAVMMCACDEEIGRKHLPHQLQNGTELDTQIRVRVTAGFVVNVCETCRSQPLTAYPKARIHGATSKLRRYYWREIAFEEMKRLEVWSQSNGSPSDDSPECIAARHSIENQVLADIRHLHDAAPKYVYATETDTDFIKNHSVEQVDLKATYTKDPTGKGAIILGQNGPCNVEDFVADHYRGLGFEVMALESIPFHVLFGVYTWLVIQDSSDPLVRIEGFGDRIAFEIGQRGEVIWFHRPQDFGTKGYAKRRAAAIDDHFSKICCEEGDLHWLFDYWLEPSTKLRQYLWAYRNSDVDRARRLIDIIPHSKIITILQYLLDEYWHHYLGWPDLLIYNQNEFFLAEVKASGDKLSDEQKVWIRANYERLKLPFKLIKVHKAGMIAEPSTAA